MREFLWWRPSVKIVQINKLDKLLTSSTGLSLVLEIMVKTLGALAVPNGRHVNSLLMAFPNWNCKVGIFEIDLEIVWFQ